MNYLQNLRHYPSTPEFHAAVIKCYDCTLWVELEKSHPDGQRRLWLCHDCINKRDADGYNLTEPRWFIHGFEEAVRRPGPRGTRGLRAVSVVGQSGAGVGGSMSGAGSGAGGSGLDGSEVGGSSTVGPSLAVGTYAAGTSTAGSFSTAGSSSTTGP